MKSFNYVITDEVGIHARPAGILVKEAKKYESTITIECNGKKAQLTKLMAIMSLGVKQGMNVLVSAEGSDEEVAISTLEEFFRSNL